MYIKVVLEHIAPLLLLFTSLQATAEKKDDDNDDDESDEEEGDEAQEEEEKDGSGDQEGKQLTLDSDELTDKMQQSRLSPDIAEPAVPEDEDGDTKNDTNREILEELTRKRTGETSPTEMEEDRTDKDRTENARDLSDNDDDLEDIGASNRQYRPHRTEASQSHVNFHSQRTRSSDSMCSAATSRSTIMDQSMVRAKVKKSMLKKQKAAQRRRLAKGEAGAATEIKRDHRDNIKASTSDVWF